MSKKRILSLSMVGALLAWALIAFLQSTVSASDASLMTDPRAQDLHGLSYALAGSEAEHLTELVVKSGSSRFAAMQVPSSSDLVNPHRPKNETAGEGVVTYNSFSKSAVLSEGSASSEVFAEAAADSVLVATSESAALSRGYVPPSGGSVPLQSQGGELVVTFASLSDPTLPLTQEGLDSAKDLQPSSSDASGDTTPNAKQETVVDNTTHSVPEGGWTFVLVASGLVSLVFFRRKMAVV